MFNLQINKTTSTPCIIIDEGKKYMFFAGESFPENVSKFYSDVTNWLTGYLKTDFGILTFDCKLVYFNSSTSKLLMNILSAMDSAVSDKNKIIVNWECNPENDIIVECGEEFGEDFVNLEFNIIFEKMQSNADEDSPQT